MGEAEAAEIVVAVEVGLEIVEEAALETVGAGPGTVGVGPEIAGAALETVEEEVAPEIVGADPGTAVAVPKMKKYKSLDLNGLKLPKQMT